MKLPTDFCYSLYDLYQKFYQYRAIVFIDYFATNLPKNNHFHQIKDVFPKPDVILHLTCPTLYCIMYISYEAMKSYFVCQ